MPNVALEQEVIAAASTSAFVIAYCIYTLLVYTNTARSTEDEQRLSSEALTSKIGLLQNFRACKKWISLSSNF